MNIIRLLYRDGVWFTSTRKIAEYSHLLDVYDDAEIHPQSHFSFE